VLVGVLMERRAVSRTARHQWWDDATDAVAAAATDAHSRRRWQRRVATTATRQLQNLVAFLRRHQLHEFLHDRTSRRDWSRFYVPLDTK